MLSDKRSKEIAKQIKASKIVEKSPKDLLPYARNPRKHSDAQINQIAASIEQFGFANPVLIDASDVIVAGHGRVLAAMKLGLESVPTISLGHLTDAQRRAYVIVDNQLTLNSEWDTELLSAEVTALKEDDFDLDVLSFDQTELDELIKEPNDPEKDAKEDEVPEFRENKRNVKTGDVWLLGEHRLLCGDCRVKENVDRLMDGEKADMVFTDPSYGLSYVDKNEYFNLFGKSMAVPKRIAGDHQSASEMSKLWCSTFNILSDASSDKASYYISSPQGGLLLTMMQAIDQSPWSLKHILIWVKNNHVLGRCDYNYKHEPILYGWKKKGSHTFYGKGNFKTSVWTIDKPLSNKLHPTMKPIALIEEACLNSTKKNDLVMDIFLGSGSTLIACEKTNRRCYGMEIDPHYCSVIIERYEEYSGKRAHKA